MLYIDCFKQNFFFELSKKKNKKSIFKSYDIQSKYIISILKGLFFRFVDIDKSHTSFKACRNLGWDRWLYSIQANIDTNYKPILHWFAPLRRHRWSKNANDKKNSETIVQVKFVYVYKRNQIRFYFEIGH